MKESFRKFVTRLSKEDSLVGDLCFDILRDKKFNWRWGAKRKREYFYWLPMEHSVVLDAVEEFLPLFDEFYKAELPEDLDDFDLVRAYIEDEDEMEEDAANKLHAKRLEYLIRNA